MKRIYNNTICVIVGFVLAFPLLALLAMKYALNVVAKLLKAIRATVQVSIVYIRTLKEELVKALNVRD